MHKVVQKLLTVKMNLTTTCAEEDSKLAVRHNDNTLSNSNIAIILFKCILLHTSFEKFSIDFLKNLLL